MGQRRTESAGFRHRGGGSVPRSILVIKPSSLGDVVHALPAVACLKQSFPLSRLSWLINPEWAPLLEGNPFVDEVIPFPRRDFRQPSKWVSVSVWLRKMRSLQPDLVCDFQGLLRSALLARWSRGRFVAGLSDAREGARFFYDRVATVRHEHAVTRYLKLAALCGADEGGEPRFPLPQGQKPAGRLPDAPFILFHPFSRGAGKSLSPAEVEQFCAAANPANIVLVGRTGVPVLAQPNCTDLLNTTSLLELIWLIRAAAFTVSVDSGPMHIAAAITTRVLSIHTWSDPALVGPYNPEAWILSNQQIRRARGSDTTPLSSDGMSHVAAFVRRQITPG